MDTDQLIERINAADFSEFRIGNPLINDIEVYKNDELAEERQKVTYALAMRHHWLQNKQAPSTAALRHAIKSIEGIYLNSLWDLLLSEQPDEQEAAGYILGEIGGVGVFQKTLNILRHKPENHYAKLLPCLTHTIARYYAIRNEGEPTAQAVDPETGEVKTLTLKDNAPDLYEKAIIERESMNEFFYTTTDERIDEMVKVLGEIDETHFVQSTKNELISAVEGLKTINQ